MIMSIPNFFFYKQSKENREKYTFGFGEDGIHYTLLYVSHKKAFDFHKKDDNSNNQGNLYSNFFEMSSFKFFRLLRKLAIIQEYLAKEFIIKNKINIGKLKKYNCWLMAIDDIASSKDVYTIERKGRMIKSNKKINLKGFMEDLNLLHPDEINDSIDNVFSLLRYIM